MPPYRDKMRLKRYLVKHVKCDPLTEYLILEGFSYKIIESGLEPFVSSWEESVKWIKIDSQPVSEEYYHDLSHRTCLFLTLQLASPEQIEPYSERIIQADELFKMYTIEIDTPFNQYTDNIDKIEKRIHWWLFRIPPKGLY